MNKFAIFSYGSLINSFSRKKTLKIDVETNPIRIKKEAGFYREWNYHSCCCMKLTALGLNYNKNNTTTVNGIVFLVNQDQLNRLDIREKGYDRIIVLPHYIIDLQDRKNNVQKEMMDIILKGKIPTYAYIPKKMSKPNIEFPIREMYINLCIEGCKKYGRDFVEEFRRTTYNTINK